MSKIKITIDIPTQITLTHDQLIMSLSKALYLDGYMLEDDVVYEYTRVSYDDYGYVPIKIEHDYQKNIVKKLKLLAELKAFL